MKYLGTGILLLSLLHSFSLDAGVTLQQECPKEIPGGMVALQSRDGSQANPPNCVFLDQEAAYLSATIKKSHADVSGQIIPLSLINDDGLLLGVASLLDALKDVPSETREKKATTFLADMIKPTGTLTKPKWALLVRYLNAANYLLIEPMFSAGLDLYGKFVFGGDVKQLGDWSEKRYSQYHEEYLIQIPKNIQRLLIERSSSLFPALMLTDIKHDKAVHSMALNPKGDRLLTGSADNTAKLWDSSGKLIATLQHDGSVGIVAFSPSGDLILTASVDKTAKLWDTSGRLITTLKHEDSVTSAVFSPSGDRILTASGDKTAKLWDASGRLITTLKHEHYVTSAVFSPTGDRILTGSYDETAKMWDITGKLLATMQDDNWIAVVRFSPNGDRVLTGSWGKTAKLWDTTGKLLATLNHDSGVTAAEFSPSGELLVTGSRDKSVKLWDARGDLLGVVKGDNWVHRVGFSPRGDRILTVSGMVSVHDYVSGRLLQAFFVRRGPAHFAGFGLDGDRLMTGFADGSANLWFLLDPSQLTDPLAEAQIIAFIKTSGHTKNTLPRHLFNVLSDYAKKYLGWL